MKPLIALIFLSLSTALLAIPSFAQTARIIGPTPTPQVKLELADTPAKAERGLMFRKDIPEGTGMWFIFAEDAERVFWMKNVSFPLDMLFIDASFTIRKIIKMVPPCIREPCPRYYSGTPVRYVLEVPGGYCQRRDVKEGQKVEYAQ
jgi:hypothetical protein